MTVFIIVFALAGALFFGLRYWGRRVQTGGISTPDGGETLGDRIEAQTDNLEFAADLVQRAARRARSDDRASSDSSSVVSTGTADSDHADRGIVRTAPVEPSTRVRHTCV